MHCIFVVLSVLHVRIHLADIDECSQGLDDCSRFARCVNTEGGYRCVCLPGYQGSGRVCTGIIYIMGALPCIHCIMLCNGIFLFIVFLADIDECALGTDDCDFNADCQNVPGSYRCICRAGFEGDGKSCEGI